MGLFGREQHPAADFARAYRPRVVVKFKPDVKLSYAVSAEAEFAGAHETTWYSLQRAFPGATLKPYFATIPRERLESLQAGAARRSGRDPRFTACFGVTVPSGDLAAAVKLIAAWPQVEFAHLEPVPLPPPVTPGDDPKSMLEEYLNQAPTGIDANFVWNNTGADGSGEGFADCESGWTLDHVDLVNPNIPVVTGVNKAHQQVNGNGVGFAGHGTAVLGIVVARDNTSFGIGIAPNADARVAGFWRTDGTFNPAETIVDLLPSSNSIIGALKPGDVMLLETAGTLDFVHFVPFEIYPIIFLAIQAAVANGIIVVEPAGNTFKVDGMGNLVGDGVNLDDFVDGGGKHIFNRNSPDFLDSGAIIVGGCVPATRARTDFSGFGSRIDCFAWGLHIRTTGDGLQDESTQTPTTNFTMEFGGTSGASAIVAGAAVLYQSWARKHLLIPAKPAELRALFSDPSLNTPSQNSLVDRIGVMPNLRQIIETRPSLNVNVNRWLAVIRILFGIIQDGGGLGFGPGGVPIHIGPWGPDGPVGPLASAKRDILLGVAMTELASLAADPKSRAAINEAGLTVLRGGIERLTGEFEE